MALWDIYLTPSSWRRPEISWLSGDERKRAEALISPLWNAREKLWLDKRYLYCHVIAVHPEYQRKGIGQLLMENGIKVAQKAELPIYIESSLDGVRLYEKSGCRRLKQPHEHDTKDLKPPRAQGDGESSEVVLFVWVPKSGEGMLPDQVELA